MTPTNTIGCRSFLMLSIASSAMPDYSRTPLA
jgi:hypothetical protein